jgi:catecholate siderophore receptor
MSFKLNPISLAILATLTAGSAAYGAEDTLQEVKVRANSERADGPVAGYRATRSATFTKTDTPLKEVPASVTVVPADLMNDQAMHSLADVIRYVPGALTHQGEGNRDEFILRGIDTSANLFVDGIRDDAQVFRDLYNLERVEVLKGAGGMIFGRGAGGVVNRVTKRPEFNEIGEVNLTVGSYDQLRTTIDAGNKLNDTAAWRLNAMTERANSFRNGADMNRYAINPTFMLVPNDQTTVILGYEHLHDERTADRGFPAQNGHPYNADPSTFFGNAAQSEARSTVDGAYAILDHNLGAGVQLKNSFRVAHYDKFYQNVYPDNANSSSVDASGNMRLAAYNNANQRTNIFNQTDLTTKFKTGDFEHTLLTGLELGHQDSTNLRNTGMFGATTTIQVPASNPYAVATSFSQRVNDANNNIQANIAGLYAQDQIALSKEWKLLAGLRYDYFRASLDDRRSTGTPGQTIPPTDLARTDKEFSPRIGLIWTPDTASSYYVSYSSSFIPSADTLGLSVLNTTTGVTTADLAPQKAKNYEMGGRWDLLPKLTVSAALFRMDLDNVRNSDGAGGFVLVGQTRTQGVELGLEGNIMRNWQMFAGYAHLDSSITKATAAAGTLGHRPQLVPENTWSVWNKFALGDGWSTGLGVIYQGASFTNVDNVVQLPSFTRTDAAVYYAFADGKTRLALNVENLLNKEYFSTADGNNNISPGAPRNVRLTLSRNF